MAATQLFCALTETLLNFINSLFSQPNALGIWMEALEIGLGTE